MFYVTNDLNRSIKNNHTIICRKAVFVCWLVGFVSVQSMIGRKATLSGSFHLSSPWLSSQLVKLALWPRAECCQTRAVATGGALSSHRHVATTLYYAIGVNSFQMCLFTNLYFVYKFIATTSSYNLPNSGFFLVSNLSNQWFNESVITYLCQNAKTLNAKFSQQVNLNHSDLSKYSMRNTFSLLFALLSPTITIQQ